MKTLFFLLLGLTIGLDSAAMGSSVKTRTRDAVDKLTDSMKRKMTDSTKRKRNRFRNKMRGAASSPSKSKAFDHKHFQSILQIINYHPKSLQKVTQRLKSMDRDYPYTTQDFQGSYLPPEEIKSMLETKKSTTLTMNDFKHSQSEGFRTSWNSRNSPSPSEEKKRSEAEESQSNKPPPSPKVGPVANYPTDPPPTYKDATKYDQSPPTYKDATKYDATKYDQSPPSYDEVVAQQLAQEAQEKRAQMS